VASGEQTTQPATPHQRPIRCYWHPLLGERSGVRGEWHEELAPVESPRAHRLHAPNCRCARTLTPALSHREREPVLRGATPLPLAIVFRYENPFLRATAGEEIALGNGCRAAHWRSLWASRSSCLSRHSPRLSRQRRASRKSRGRSRGVLSSSKRLSLPKGTGTNPRRSVTGWE